MGPLGPVWAKSNEAKKVQAGQPPTLKARWAHLHQFRHPISPVPQIAKRTPGPKLAKNHFLAIFDPWPLAITRGHQIEIRNVSSSFKGQTSLHQCTPYHGFRNSAYMV
ncbi:hypothetical protein O181_100576 [Austropuccinia psidii MF-1]|uniref:Uncharacterized protein n=1 Tax=Austropuccinia psidii MF-1 TaxID=1389203 RepID=A0A9Q3JF20_9BASI|nr:hypothetical protein [Austropuccinia psidii MF-1]